MRFEYSHAHSFWYKKIAMLYASRDFARSRFPGVSALASLVQQHIFKTDPLCKAQSFGLTYKFVWIFTEASSVRLSEASPINTED